MTSSLPGAKAVAAFALQHLGARRPCFEIASTLLDADDAGSIERFPAADALGTTTRPFAGGLCAFPTRLGPLIPFMSTVREHVSDDGVVIVSDLVWQTAPTPQLLSAFGPAPGLEPPRPVEGYEMQLDHAGFEVAAREVLPREAWVADFSPQQRAAVEADDRGAAQVVAWALRPA